MTHSATPASACSTAEGLSRSADDGCGGPGDSGPTSSAAAGMGVAGTAAATSALAVGASAACCVIPLALPAVAAGALGGALAWFGRTHVVFVVLATALLIAAWAWVAWQSRRRRLRPSPATLLLMGIASVMTVVALAWPALESPLMSAVA